MKLTLKRAMNRAAMSKGLGPLLLVVSDVQEDSTIVVEAIAPSDRYARSARAQVRIAVAEIGSAQAADRAVEELARQFSEQADS